MPLNRDFIGREFSAAEPYEVSRVKIREFAEAIGDPNPVYRSAAAARALGHPDVLAPPTFAFVVIGTASDQSPIFDPEFGMRYEFVVHGEQRFTYHRPIRAGDVLSVRSRIADISNAKRNEILHTGSELRAADGELVCTALNVLVSRGTAVLEETR
ncbi:MaoC family dehydratase N-terminal domain-containing protein [Streptomyces sp. NPDC005373]|uniref:MaoC family dehydratase N-terminal domain-containing protein n=1 Tax=Streptomyces sp. NPDC005373 TaxID=3156879 RepID=UPI0033B7C5D9